MDCFRDMDCGVVFVCFVGNRGDDEFIGFFGDVVEVCGLRFCILFVVEVVGDVEGRCVRECVGDMFVNVVVVVWFKRVDRWCIEELDVDCRVIDVVFLLVIMGVFDFLDMDLLIVEV